MANDREREPATGRVTRKTTSAPSGRYTPPVPKQVKVSPRWVPIVMCACLLLGTVAILLNYVNVLPGGAKNEYLLVGLVLITGGFIVATQWK